MVKYPKDRFGQEKEPAPIDGVDEFVHALRLIVAQNFPFFGTGEQLCGDRCCLPACDSLRRHHGFGLKNLSAWQVLD